MSDRLKTSLSEILTEFYPLAGRTNINSQSTDCNDDGLEYIEARVQGSLNQVLSCPEADELNQLIPGEGLKGLCSVQVSIFGCGGMAIGVTISHTIADASSLAIFVNSWAAIARGTNKSVSPSPIFGFASLFPPRDMPPIASEAKAKDYSAPQKIARKRFVFDGSKIADLKAVSANECPTRVEVVSAVIYKCLINVARSSGSSKFIDLRVPVNIRSRMSQPLPPHSFGNLLTLTGCSTTESEPELHCLVGKLKQMFRNIDGDVMDADGIYQLYVKKDTTRYHLTSWCRFPFYKIDFGWGVPTWATHVNLQGRKNYVTLLDTKDGDGIEAWVSLEKDDMEIFECQQQLLDFACANPMVIDSLTQP